DPVFNSVTGQHENPRPEDVSDAEVRRWIQRMDVVENVGGYNALIDRVGADLVSRRRGLRVIRLAKRLYGATPDKTTFDDLAWLAGQLDPVSSNISQASLSRIVANFEGRADGDATFSEVDDLVSLAGRAREFLGRVDGDPKAALEAIWNADKSWLLMGKRLGMLETTARVKNDEQLAEWARELLVEIEDARSVVVREPAESQARLNAVVLPSFLTKIAERFEGGWSGLAAEIGLGDEARLPADYEQSLLNLAELYWETGPDLYELGNAVPGMRRLRMLIGFGFEDGREGAAFYKRTVDDLQSLAAELSGQRGNPQAGGQKPASGAVQLRRWLARMDLVHELGGVGAVVGEIGADLASGRRLLPIIRLAEEFYGKRPGVETLRGLAWVANQLDPQSSNISPVSLSRMVAGFEGRADGYALRSDVQRLVELAGKAREFFDRVDGDPKEALEEIWKADRRWERMKNQLTEVEKAARVKHDAQLAEWARGLLVQFEGARSVVVREPAESQARLNAVVLTPFVTMIAERFGGGWSEVAAEVGLGNEIGLPADYRQSLLNLAGLYWEIDSGFFINDNAMPGMRRLRMLIDAGFDDGREGAACYARTMDDLRRLLADLSAQMFNSYTEQDELRSPANVGVLEIRRWLGRMDLVHDLGGVAAIVGEIGTELVGGWRLFSVLQSADQLYGERLGIGTLRDVARELRVAEARKSLGQNESRQAELAMSLKRAESRQAELAAVSVRNAGEDVELDSLRERIGALRAEIGELAGRVEAEQGVLEGLVNDARQARGQDDVVTRGRKRTNEELPGSAESPSAEASSSVDRRVRLRVDAPVELQKMAGLIRRMDAHLAALPADFRPDVRSEVEAARRWAQLESWSQEQVSLFRSTLPGMEVAARWLRGVELSGAGASSSAGEDLRGAGSAGVSGAGVEGQ
ncbi:hypothetical protein ACWDKQ_35695, partial [Saccharopolyspora sp. NPDC000995]